MKGIFRPQNQPHALESQTAAVENEPQSRIYELDAACPSRAPDQFPLNNENLPELEMNQVEGTIRELRFKLLEFLLSNGEPNPKPRFGLMDVVPSISKIVADCEESVLALEEITFGELAPQVSLRDRHIATKAEEEIERFCAFMGGSVSKRTFEAVEAAIDLKAHLSQMLLLLSAKPTDGLNQIKPGMPKV